MALYGTIGRGHGRVLRFELEQDNTGTVGTTGTVPVRTVPYGTYENLFNTRRVREEDLCTPSCCISSLSVYYTRRQCTAMHV